MFKRLVIGVLAGALLLTGCNNGSSQDQNLPDNSTGQVGQVTDLPGEVEKENQGEQGKEDSQESTPGLGGIHLGDDFTKAEELLGKDYKETLNEEQGHFSEAYYLREYSKGITLIVGKDSNKILEISVYSPDYPTNLGVKVGHTAEKVSQVYSAKYKLMESRHGYGLLEGFYLVEDGMVMIFDYNKGDNQIVNSEVKPDSQVEMIRLTRAEYLD